MNCLNLNSVESLLLGIPLLTWYIAQTSMHVYELEYLNKNKVLNAITPIDFYVKYQKNYIAALLILIFNQELQTSIQSKTLK